MCPATALNILFPVLDHRRTLPVEIAGSKDIREIPIHPEVCFISTCNIGIEYTGTSTLDKALTNRFFPIEFDYLDPSIETKVLIKKCDISRNDASIISSIADSIRKLKASSDLETAISTRETLMIGDLVHDGWELTTAIKTILLPLYGKDERDKIIKLIMSK